MSTAFVIFVAAFIVMSTVEIARGVYSEPVVNAGAPPSPECVTGISRLVKALDRAMASASASSEESAAIAELAQSSAPEWNDATVVEGKCASTAQGKDAFSALMRLRVADEAFLRRKVAEIAPIRRDVDAYLR